MKSDSKIREIPFADAAYFRKHSPYYKESHGRLRAAIRAFVEREIVPTAAADDENNRHPSPELFLKM